MLQSASAVTGHRNTSTSSFYSSTYASGQNSPGMMAMIHHHPSSSTTSSPSSPSVSSSSSSTAMMHDHHLNHHHHHHQHLQKDCSLCWTPNGGHNTYAKTRTIRLQRKDQNTSLGFSIRGGYEHGIGFFVSEVQQQSLAAKKGLCAGDQILQINGFPLERVVHEEVVALIRLSSNDLHLRVRSTGLVPQKASPGEALTWKRLHSALNNATASGNPNNGGVCGTTSASSEVSSFVFTRPRSAASDSFTPSSSSESSTSSSEEVNTLNNHHLCDHHHHLHQNHHHHSHHNLHHTPHNHHHHLSNSSEESSCGEGINCSSPPLPGLPPTPPPPPPPISSSALSAPAPSHHPLLPLPLVPYNEKQLYIRCHHPGSSLGCSVVNGPASCPGIFVQAVKEGKLAAKCGLEVGDQIVKVNSVDVSAIGFEGAITLLKSLSSLSLLVRKGVARHIFECSRDTYDVFGSSKECHFTTYSSTSGPKPLVKSPSESSLYYPSSSTLNNSHPQSSPLYSTYYQHAHHSQHPQQQQQQQLHHLNHHHHHHHQQNQYHHKSSTHLLKCSSAAVGYATVQISSASENHENNQIITCDKPRCCCKRQRTVTAAAAAAAAAASAAASSAANNSSTAAAAQLEQLSIYEPCSSCALMTLQSNSNLHHHHPHHNHHMRPLPPPPPHSLAFTTDPMHLDHVTSAMANSIRILREVREKEEKLVEASRKLSEEHQKLCREKEKLKLYELEKSPQPDHRKDSNSSTSQIPTPPSFESFSINSASQYSTLSTAPIGSLSSSVVSGIATKVTSATTSRHNTVGPTFSFLEEIKALGEHGTKRHLRPINSTDTFGGRGGGRTDNEVNDNTSATLNVDSKGKLLRRLVPFGVANGVVNGGGGVAANSKEAETKQRQHELLMEEFRIAHQRMFGGKENNGTLLGKIRQNKLAAAGSSSETAAATADSSSDSAKSTDSPKSHPQPQQKETMTRLVQSGKAPPNGKASSAATDSVLTPSVRPSVGKANGGEQQQSFSNGNSTTAAASHNRITIKVLSPKLGT